MIDQSRASSRLLHFNKSSIYIMKLKVCKSDINSLLVYSVNNYCRKVWNQIRPVKMLDLIWSQTGLLPDCIPGKCFENVDFFKNNKRRHNISVYREILKTNILCFLIQSFPYVVLYFKGHSETHFNTFCRYSCLIKVYSVCLWKYDKI